MQLPGWQVDLLSRALPALMAEEMMARAGAGRLAWADNRIYRSQMERWEKAARPEMVYDGPAAVLPATDEAREWFIANGIRVIEA